MRKRFLKSLFFVLSIFLNVVVLGKNVYASTLCSASGYTVLSVNGIFTDENGAKTNTYALKRKLSAETYNNQPLTVDYLYNPTHLAGVADLIDVVKQGFFDQKSDYDLVEMLNDASQKVTTQKVLLVAHSQGNFYANNFYDKTASQPGGVPSQSIGVYGVASPANRVTGGGKYLTSDTDNVIASVVARYINILSPNVHIPLQNIDGNGHSFSDVYLKYQGDKIISDIKFSLDKLKENDEQLPQDPCISPPELTTIHKIQGAVLAVADPTAIVVKDGIIVTYNVGVYVATGIYNTGLVIGNTTINIANTFVSGISSLAQSILNNTKSLAANNPASVINSVDDTNSTMAENVSSGNVLDSNTANDVTTQPTNPTTPEPAEARLPQNTEINSVNTLPPVVSTAVFHGGRVAGTSSSSTPQTQTEENSSSPDLTLPVISIIGDNPIEVTKNTSYVDAGATALDDIDGDLTSAILKSGTFIDTTTIGTYTIIYTATDLSNNVATKTRIVNVVVPSSPPPDTTPPIISALALTPNSGSVGVGGTVTLTITADADNYVAGEIKVNNVATTGFTNIGNNNYTVIYTVALHDANRSAGTIPVSVILTDGAGNSNTAYIVSANTLVINGQISNSSIQVFPTFLSDGRLKEDVVLNCNSNGTDISMMYAISEADNAFHYMNDGVNNVYCPSGHQTFISKGSKFQDFAGYQEIVGWYYVSIFSSGTQNCSPNNSNPACVPNPPATFVRLHRNSSGIWSNSDIPPHGNIPTITTSTQSVNTDSITIAGTAEVNSTITITGGASVATGTATGGNYSISVVLNQNTINDLNVTATDASNNTSSEATVLITHDNIPPIISPIIINEGPANNVLVGGTFSVNVSADAPNYTINEFTINGVPATNIIASGTNYLGWHTVSMGETERSSGSVPVSVVLTDPAGNSNTVYTTVRGNGLVINGHYPLSVTQVSPSFNSSNGKFTQNVVLPCITSSGYYGMYYVADSDSAFHKMNLPDWTVSCSDGNSTFVSSGNSFEDFLGYAPVVGWYYGIVSIGDSKYDTYRKETISTSNNIQSFFRLHRDAAGVWSDTDVVDVTPPSVTSYTLNGTSGDITINLNKANPLSLIFNASENVNWMSIKIENQTDPSIYKIFQSGADCVDGTNICTKKWEGDLSSGGLLQSGTTYKIRVHTQDAAKNDYEEYLPSIITIN